MVPQLPLVRDNFLHLPLFHGTSSRNIESILNFGLGGADPVSDLAVLEFAREFFPVAFNRRHEIGDFWYAKEFELEGFVKQSAGHSNWRHGSLYLTSSEVKAAIYSANKCGSEAIGFAYDISRMLQNLDAGLLNPARQKYERLFRRFEEAETPILVRIDALPLERLKSETGGDPSRLIVHLEQQILDDPELWPHINQAGRFEYCGTVPANLLRFYEVRGNPREDFELVEVTGQALHDLSAYS